MAYVMQVVFEKALGCQLRVSASVTHLHDLTHPSSGSGSRGLRGALPGATPSDAPVQNLSLCAVGFVYRNSNVAANVSTALDCFTVPGGSHQLQSDAPSAVCLVGTGLSTIEFREHQLS